MAIEYFCCYHSYRRKIAKLSDQEVGRLFRSLLEYSETGETQELAGREAVAFDFIADDIDRARESYEAKIAQRAENGRKGAVNRWIANDGKDSECHNFMANDSKNSNCHFPIANDGKNGKDKEEYKDKNKYKDDVKKESKKKKAAAFTPPTLEEVEAYCKERGNKVDAKRFFDFFSEADWIDSKGNKVKSWKQKVITWESFSNNSAVKAPEEPKKSVLGMVTKEELERRRKFIAEMENKDA